MTENNATDNDDASNISDVSIPRPIRFWLLLLSDIPAIACTLFLLYHLLFKRTLRQALHNHVVIILLINAIPCYLIDVLSYIIFLQLGYVWIFTPAFCALWSFVDIGLFDMIAMLMAFAAIERHILVFHRRWMITRRKRILFHYLPLCLIVIYYFVFYISVIFFPPCENLFDSSQPWCGYPCYYDDTIIFMYDTVVNCIIPVLLIIILSIGLIVRFIRQKRRVRQRMRWRKHRKMVIQLLSISSLYLIFYLPLLILLTAHQYGLPEEIGADVELYTYFLSLYVILLLPYICLGSLPELWKYLNIYPIRWIRARLQRTNIVTPINAQQRY